MRKPPAQNANATITAYNQCLQQCRDIFISKARDYGTSWRVYRTISIADQIYIKAWRIRQIQEGVVQRIEDSDISELKAIVNYAIMGIMLSNHLIDTGRELPLEDAERLYDQTADEVRALMVDKNHDYGEAWRDMSQESFVDLILTKVLRIRQIWKNDGKTLISEGIDANFADIMNYALFALILKNKYNSSSTK